MTDTSETAKIIKRWYHSSSRRLTVNVLLNNITFLWFLLFSKCQSLRVDVSKRINWCFVYISSCCSTTKIMFFYRWSVIIYIFCTTVKMQSLKSLESRPWLPAVTWRHRSRDHLTRRGHFPIGGQWWPCIYQAPLWSYDSSKLMGSRPWSFGVTWRHRSRDQ